MGTYTDGNFVLPLRKNIDQQVLDFLRLCTKPYDPDIKEWPWPSTDTDRSLLPIHELFNDSRWDWIVTASKTNGLEDSGAWLSDDLIYRVKFSLKNYDNTIEKFLDWILPYLDPIDKELGFTNQEGSTLTRYYRIENGALKWCFEDDGCED